MIKQRPATERFFLAIMLSTLSILLALPSLAVAEAAPAQLRVGLIDEVQELYPDTVLVEPVRQLTVHTARNTLAGVSIMITGLSGSSRIQFGESSPDGSATPGLRWLRLIDVPVLENTGLDRNTEKYSGKINPYVIRRAPFRVYDPLEPVHSPLTVSSSSLALRVEVPITATMAAGTYRHQLKVTIGAQVEVLELTVVVHAALVPPVNQATLAYINWHSIDNICSAHGVEKWSEPFWAMLAQYAQLMAALRTYPQSAGGVRAPAGGGARHADQPAQRRRPGDAAGGQPDALRRPARDGRPGTTLAGPARRCAARGAGPGRRLAGSGWDGWVGQRAMRERLCAVADKGQQLRSQAELTRFQGGFGAEQPGAHSA